MMVKVLGTNGAAYIYAADGSLQSLQAGQLLFEQDRVVFVPGAQVTVEIDGQSMILTDTEFNNAVNRQAAGTADAPSSVTVEDLSAYAVPVTENLNPHIGVAGQESGIGDLAGQVAAERQGDASVTAAESSFPAQERNEQQIGETTPAVTLTGYAAVTTVTATETDVPLKLDLTGAMMAGVSDQNGAEVTDGLAVSCCTLRICRRTPNFPAVR